MLIPTIQTESIKEVQQKLNEYQKITLPGKPTHFQIDINDGFFTDHSSVQPFDLNRIDWHGYTHEYHLLVDHPDEYLGDVVESGATTVIAQIEHLPDRQNFVDTAHQLRLKVGLALDLYTPISELTKSELQAVDVILLMSYKAGHSGPAFNPLVLEKIKELRQSGFDKPIEIDGGVNSDNAASLIQAGATSLAVNSSLWHNGTVAENLQKLLNACHL